MLHAQETDTFLALTIRAALHVGIARRLDGTAQAAAGCLAEFLGRMWGIREDFLEEVMAKA